jgi:hypothetical protein
MVRTGSSGIASMAIAASRYTGNIGSQGYAAYETKLLESQHQYQLSAYLRLLQRSCIDFGAIDAGKRANRPKSIRAWRIPIFDDLLGERPAAQDY